MRKALICLLMAVMLILPALCAAEQAITLPAALTSLEDEAFMGNTLFEHVVLSEGLTAINARAFAGCEGLKTVFVPDSVTYIAEDAFDGCGELVFRCGWESYAARYAQGKEHITVSFTDEAPLSLACSHDLAEAGTEVTWTIVHGMPQRGDTYDLMIYQGETVVYSHERASAVENGSVALTVQEGEYQAVATYHSAGGESLQVIGGKLQAAGPMTATLAPMGEKTEQGCYMTWILQPRQAAGSAVVRYTVYFEGEIYAETEHTTSLTCQLALEKKGVYTACAEIVDGLGRSLQVESAPVTVISNYNSSSQPLTYRLNADGQSYSVADCDISATRISIPDQYNGLPVTAIDAGAFMFCENLTEVATGRYLKHIGAYAFYGCTALNGISPYTSPESIGEAAFAYCSNMQSLYMTAKLTELPARVAEGCTSLTYVAMSGNLTTIGEEAFKGCTSFASFTVPASVTRIESGAFEDCTGLTEIIFPTGSFSMGSEVFARCTALTSIALPDHLADMGESVFAGCSRLTEATLPQTMTSLPQRTFAACAALKSITLPESMEKVEDSAFAGCAALKTAVFENVDTAIDQRSFAYCPQVELQSWGEGSLKTQAEAARLGYRNTAVPAITAVNLMTAEPVAGRRMSWSARAAYGTAPYTYAFDVYCDEQRQAGGVQDNGDFTFIPAKGGMYRLTVTVTDALGASVSFAAEGTEVGPGAAGTLEWLVYKLNADGASYAITSIYNNHGEHIVIPETIDDLPVTTIGYAAFRNSNIASVVIPDSVTTIENYAFYRTSHLKEVTFGSGVTVVGDFAFQECGVSKLVLPTTMTTLGMDIFRDCKSLTELVIPYGVTTLGQSMFSGCTALESVEVPASVVNAERYIFSGCIALKEAVWNAAIDTLPQSLFYDCTSLSGVKIGHPITAIGSHALKGTAITTLQGLENVVTVGYGAFNGCTSLTHLELMADAESILLDGEAFRDCTRLRYVEARPETILVTEDGTFRDCTSLTELRCSIVHLSKYGDYVKYSSGQHNFTGCTSLEEISIWGNVPPQCFQGCTSLEKIAMTHCETICFEAFKGCTSLKDVRFAQRDDNRSFYTLEIQKEAFMNCAGLETLNLRNGYTHFGINESGFENCTSLKRVTLPVSDCAFWLAEAAFRNCAALEQVDNLDCYLKLGDECFKNCVSLTSLDLEFVQMSSHRPSRSIGKETFANCENLASVSFGYYMKEIGEDAFAGCPLLVPSAPSGSYAAKYFAEQDLLTPAANQLTPLMTAEVTLGDIQPDHKSVAATLTIYNSRGGSVPAGSNWASALASAKLNNVKVEAYCSCMQIALNGEVGSIGYLGSAEVPLMLTCTSEIPASCSHGTLVINISADGQDAISLNQSMAVKFPRAITGDLVISEPAAITVNTSVSGNVYIRDVLSLEDAGLTCGGNVYVEGPGTLYMRGNARLAAGKVEVAAGGQVILTGFSAVNAKALNCQGSLTMQTAASRMNVTDLAITGKGVLTMKANAEIHADTFLFDTESDHGGRLTNGAIVARKADLRRNFHATGKQAVVITGGECSLLVEQTMPLQRFASLMIGCPIGNLTISGNGDNIPFACEHFGLAESAVKTEVLRSDDVAREIYEKFSAARLESLTETEAELARAARDWYTVTLDTTGLTAQSIKEANKAATYAEKAVLNWAMETMAASPEKWKDCNDVINAIVTTATETTYTFTVGTKTYTATVTPLGGLTATSASAGAGTVTCQTGDDTFRYVYSLSLKGIRENGDTLLKVLRQYAQEEFITYINKALEESMGKKNAKYALAIVKVIETGLIEEKDFMEVIADKYGKDIAKKLMERQFPQVKKIMKFITAWEKYIKKADSLSTQLVEVRGGDALPSDLIKEFLQLTKLIP